LPSFFVFMQSPIAANLGIITSNQLSLLDVVGYFQDNDVFLVQKSAANHFSSSGV
jgi:hypothetical protein